MIDVNSIPISSFDTGLDIAYSEEYMISPGYNESNTVELSFEGKLYMENSDKYRLKGCLNVNAIFNCDKCLTQLAKNYCGTVNEVFSENIGEDDWPMKNGIIEFSEAIRSNVFSLLPMKILCSEHCRGLCLLCGKNLNEEYCGCKKPLDSRFNLLSSFFDSDEEGV